jgi:SAM-dependent methyltransferase
VLVGDVERMASPFAPATFDAIVCGDVLEHLREPETFLRQARSWLRPQGSLIASIPNVRHHSVVRGLLAGNWTYEAAGLLDRTHLRFFTRRSIETLFEGAGFRIDPGGGFEDENAVRRRAHLLSGEDRMRRRPRARASGFIRFFVKPGDPEQRRALLDHYQQAP